MVVLGAAMLLSTPVRAADDDAFDTKIMNNILEGIGLTRGGPDIEYRERSPLVIPPSRTLPAPEASAAKSNPNWPVDPEIKRNKELKAASRRTVGATGDPWIDDGRPLSPEDLARGTRSGPSREVAGRPEYVTSRPQTPGELGYKGGIFDSLFGKKPDSAPFTGEPPRTSLTEPPKGYQTPSASQPYAIGQDKTPAKPSTLADRVVGAQ